MHPVDDAELLAAAAAIPSLSTIAIELIFNSIDADSDTISLTFDPYRNQIRCRDNGHGISPELLSTIFRPNNRYDSSITHFKRNNSTLARISMLADVVISTRTESDTICRRVSSAGPQYIAPLFSPGTEVVICSIFAQIPIRTQQMAAAAYKRDEIQRILKLINTTILNFPQISISVTTGQQQHQREFKKCAHLEDRFKTITGTQLRIDSDGFSTRFKSASPFTFEGTFDPFLVNSYPVSNLVIDEREIKPTENAILVIKGLVNGSSWDNNGLNLKVTLLHEQESASEFDVGSDQIAAMSVVGVFVNKFIICHLDGVLYAIDQHAAHERVYLEHLLDSLDHQIGSQDLKQPINITIDAIRPALQDELRRWGWKLVALRGKFELRAVPVVAGNPLTDIQGLVDHIREFEGGVQREMPQCILHSLQTRACKTAIKFGDEMSREQAEELVRMLAACKRPNHCAHGRTVVAPFHSIDHPTMEFEPVERIHH
jgi:DNA mismatch repair ATPase MutL